MLRLDLYFTARFMAMSIMA